MLCSFGMNISLLKSNETIKGSSIATVDAKLGFEKLSGGYDKISHHKSGCIAIFILAAILCQYLCIMFNRSSLGGIFKSNQSIVNKMSRLSIAAHPREQKERRVLTSSEFLKCFAYCIRIATIKKYTFLTILFVVSSGTCFNVSYYGLYNLAFLQSLFMPTR